MKGVIVEAVAVSTTWSWSTLMNPMMLTSCINSSCYHWSLNTGIKYIATNFFLIQRVLYSSGNWNRTFSAWVYLKVALALSSRTDLGTFNVNECLWSMASLIRIRKHNMQICINNLFTRHNSCVWSCIL